MVCLFDLYSNTEHYLYFLSISNNNFALLIATDYQLNTIHIYYSTTFPQLSTTAWKTRRPWVILKQKTNK